MRPETGADTAIPAETSPPPSTSASEAAPADSAATPPKVVAVDDLVYLQIGRYLDAHKKKFASTDAADREALKNFYGSRMGATLWVDKNGYTADAKNLIDALKDADNWGLRSSDYKIPTLKRSASGDYSLDDLTDAETQLSVDALAYARDAHGGRIPNPTDQLSGYIDRKPTFIEPRIAINALATAIDKGAYLRSLQPQNKQFELLRQKLLALRAGKDGEAINIPPGPNLMPGKSNPQIALVRKALKVSAPSVQADGKPADATYYDDELARAVKAYKEQKNIRPITPTITMALRRSLNRGDGISEWKLLANMEEWRWMPEDLGKIYVTVNIPDFSVRLVKDGEVLFDERIVAGSVNRQTPIFSDLMRTVVFQPRWNVPDSIKIKELLPGLRAGGNPLRRQGLVMERNGRRVNAWDINWYRTDIRYFNVYQPPGGGNALGVVKFLFPNKHAVYLHDTPSKSLFKNSVRAFSHGCMRVRNPVHLAELIMNEDKGWDKSKVDSLVTKGPEENEVSLDHPIPVHITYFTARVDNDGEIESFNDIYGHEKRITLALQGKWNQIVKTKEPKITPDDIGFDEYADSRRRDDNWFGDDDDDDYRGRGRRHKHYDGGLNHFFQQVLGGGF
ncbi:L,D-transpeptidase family protein [Hyphomicrobium sp.]|uniref:L,D-transpeptidase family protein n=1 Tax=Hyphomicrobium sp. TaxID=82 RepID=UPI002C3BD4FB|nr:L,D-transpeptidase family protein [Hyphomicrobium sp.]HVZ03405.1 L,D-transpeptidase family protein [Hyphomicrobium sp.]